MGTATLRAPVKFMAAARRGQRCVTLRQLSVGIGVPVRAARALNWLQMDSNCGEDPLSRAIGCPNPTRT